MHPSRKIKKALDPINCFIYIFQMSFESIRSPDLGYAYDAEVAEAIPFAPLIDVTDVDATRCRLTDLVAQLPTWIPTPGVKFEVRSIPGLPGDPDVDLYLICPRDAVVTRGAMLWFHGGGFVLGDARDSLPFLEQIAIETGVVVASVQYRLAPESAYPAAINDGYACLAWLRESGDELGIDPERIAVGGQSAGAALAAGLALRVRDDGGRLLFQLLDIPVTDDRGETPSAKYADTLMWHRKNAEASWRAYLGPRSPAALAYAAPMRAVDLAGLPPAFITVNQFDPLRDEGIAYAQRLAHANVPVDLQMYAGTFHGSASIAATAAVSRRQDADIRAAAVRGFANPTPARDEED